MSLSGHNFALTFKQVLSQSDDLACACFMKVRACFCNVEAMSLATAHEQSTEIQSRIAQDVFYPK